MFGYRVVGFGAFPSRGADYKIQTALMFDGTADYLKLVPSAAGSTSKATYSFWVKRSGVGDAELDIVNCETDTDTQRDGISFGDGSTADLLSVRFNDANDGHIKTNDLMRDPTAWQHWVVAIDTGQTTAADRVKIYKNGTQITSFATASYPSQGYIMQGFMQDDKCFIGTTVNENNYYFDGYLAEFIGIDGIQLAASAFGENDANGVWVPKDPGNVANIADWGGSNSFWLKFDDGNDIGKNSRPTAVTANAATYKIDNSLWFDGSADRLTRTFSPGNTKTWSFSTWAKQADTWANITIFAQGDYNGDYTSLFFDGDSKLYYNDYGAVSGNRNTLLKTDGIIRDPTAWYHFLLVNDTTNGVSTDRSQIWINGVRVAQSYQSSKIPALNATSTLNQGSAFHIGHYPSNDPGNTYKGYLAETIFLDGIAASPTDLGGWDSNGIWQPVDPSSLAFTGSNSFHLDFSVAPGTSNGAGTDVSGGAVKQDISGATATNPGGGLHNFSGSGVLDDDTGQDGFYLTGDEATQTVDIDLGSGNDLAVTGAGWIVENNGSNDQAAVWSIFYSDNGSDYTDTNQNLEVVDDGTSMSEQRTLITGQSSHRYWRLTIDSTGATGNGWYSGLRLYSGGTGTSFLNTFTDVSLTAAQKNTDSPTNTAGDNEGNYATWNPLASSPNNTFSEGNLRCAMPSSGSTQTVRGSFVIQSGKWHWEATLNSGSGSWIGVLQGTNSASNIINYSGDTLPGEVGVSMTYCDDGQIYNDNGGGAGGSGISSTAPATYSAGDRITVELNADDNEIQFFKNGSSQVTITSGLAPPYMPTMFRGSNPNITINFGQTAFTDTPSSGFKALNTADLAAPTVTDPRAHYANAVYTGTAQSKTVRQCFDSTGTAWTPDFVWIKSRSEAGEHVLVDSVRGATNVLTPDGNAAEFHDIKAVTSLIEGGFTLGVGDDRNDSNDNGETYVAWCMKAGGAASSNSDGNVTGGSSVSVADHNGFAIVQYGDCGGAAKTVGHGMGQAPDMIMVKAISGGSAGSRNWRVYHKDLTSDYVLYLDLTDGQASEAASFGTIGTSTFGVDGGNGTSGNGESHIAYCFARTPGLIGIGTYIGNGSADGTYVVVDDGASGFRPAWVMVKRLEDGYAWHIHNSAMSPHNPVAEGLNANDTGTEATATFCDFTANGFKLRTTNGGYNGSATYIYLAFADQPFNSARAR